MDASRNHLIIKGKSNWLLQRTIVHDVWEQQKLVHYHNSDYYSYATVDWLLMILQVHVWEFKFTVYKL